MGTIGTGQTVLSWVRFPTELFCDINNGRWTLFIYCSQQNCIMLRGVRLKVGVLRGVRLKVGVLRGVYSIQGWHTGVTLRGVTLNGCCTSRGTVHQKRFVHKKNICLQLGNRFSTK